MGCMNCGSSYCDGGCNIRNKNRERYLKQKDLRSLKPSVDDVKTAIKWIQELGYVITPHKNGSDIEIVWLDDKLPPAFIDPYIAVLEAASSTDELREALAGYNVETPIWFIMGFPWDKTEKQWEANYRFLNKQEKTSLQQKKIKYVKECLKWFDEGYKITIEQWKKSHRIKFNEPWPIV